MTNVKPFAIECTHLLCREILFVPWSPSESLALTEQTIRNFLAQSINYVKDEGYNSVAFPAIGCGQFDLDAEFVARTMINYIKMNKSSLNVTFAIHPNSHHTFDAFQNAYGKDFILTKLDKNPILLRSIQFGCSCLARCIELCRRSR